MKATLPVLCQALNDCGLATVADTLVAKQKNV